MSDVTAQDYQMARDFFASIRTRNGPSVTALIGRPDVMDAIENALEIAAECSSDPYSVYLKMANGHEDPWDKTVLRENAGRFKEMLAAAPKDIDPAGEGVKS